MITLWVVTSAVLWQRSSTGEDESALGPLKYVYLSPLFLWCVAIFYIHMYMKFIQQFGIVSLFLRNISSLPALLGDDSGLASTESIIVILWLKMDLYEYH